MKENKSRVYNKTFIRIKNSATGITIVSLAVTIIVMVIIAGITIAATVGDNGIVAKVQEGSKNSFNNNIVDALMAIQTSYTSINEYIDFLKQNNYIDKTNVVDVKKILQLREVDYGNGKENKDIYKLEYDGNISLELNYYDANSNKEKIVDLGLTMEK